MRSGGEQRDAGADPPPLGGSWRRLYLVVVAALALEIVMFALFTVAFR